MCNNLPRARHDLECFAAPIEFTAGGCIPEQVQQDC